MYERWSNSLAGCYGNKKMTVSLIKVLSDITDTEAVLASRNECASALALGPEARAPLPSMGPVTSPLSSLRLVFGDRVWLCIPPNNPKCA